MPAQTTTPAKLSINIDGENKIFHGKKIRFKQCLSTNLALPKVLEGKLQQKEHSYIHEDTAIDNLTIAKLKEVRHTHHYHQNQKIPETTNQWSITSLSNNRLNSSIKGPRLREWIGK